MLMGYRRERFPAFKTIPVAENQKPCYILGLDIVSQKSHQSQKKMAMLMSESGAKQNIQLKASTDF